MAKQKKIKRSKYMTSTDIATQSTKASPLAKLTDTSQTYAPDASDLLIPRINAMTGTSGLVQDGQAVVGEFRDSVNGELFGSIDKPFEFVPVLMNKTLFVTQNNKFLRVEPYNKEYKREDMIDGKPVLRMVNYEFFILIPEQCKAGIGMPYIISFKSTAEKVGKKLLNQMFLSNKLKGLNPSAVVCTLGGKWVENDKGKFITPDIKPMRMATDTELKQAHQWSETLGAGDVRVHEEE